jgi:hypothetical protein
VFKLSNFLLLEAKGRVVISNDDNKENCQSHQKQRGAGRVAPEKQSGIMLTGTQVANIQIRQANSSLANNDSKEITSKATPMYQWAIQASFADREVIENAMRKDEDKERAMMAAEDKIVRPGSNGAVDSVVIEAALEARKTVGVLHQPTLTGDVGHDMGCGCCHQFRSSTTQSTREVSASRIDRSSGRGERIVGYGPPGQLDQGRTHHKNIAVHKESSDMSSQQVVRPAVLAVIENDMRGVNTMTGSNNGAAVLPEMFKNFLNSFWQ